MASITIRQNKNGSVAYVVRSYVCRDVNGKAHYLSKTYTPAPGLNEKKIQKELNRLSAELDRKAKVRTSMDSSQRFRDYADHFLQRKAITCSEYTLHSYRIGLDKACAYIGHIPLEKLSAKHLDEMVREMNAEKSQYGMPYSASTIRHIQTLVRMTLGMAVREGILDTNVADSDHYELPRSEFKEPVFLELDEAQGYMQAAMEEKDPKIRAMVLLYLYTGIRMEELCGLTWDDIDFENCRIRICRASVYIAGEGVITKPPKSHSGTRVICADPAVFQALEEYRAAKEKERIRAGERWIETGRIFTKRDGGALIPGTTSAWLQRFARDHGLRPVTPHKLRHTYATLQIAYGTDIRTVAGVMGHSSPMTTLTIYAHQVKDASEKAARAMSDMLSPRPAAGTI